MMQIPYLEKSSVLLSGQVRRAYKEFKPLALESRRPCASSNTVL